MKRTMTGPEPDGQDNRLQGSGAPPQREPRPRDPAINDVISRKLKEFYEDVARQPVPDRFMELLNELEKKSPGRSRGET